MTSDLRIEVLDPRYDPGIGPVDDAGALVDTGVECPKWRAMTPAPSAPGPLAFVDGAQRLDAWLRATRGDLDTLAAAAMSVAVGAVLAPPGERPTIVEVVVDRFTVAASDEVLGLPPAAGLSWGALAAGTAGPDPIARAVATRRSQIEHAVAERVAAPGLLVVLDGRRGFVRDAAGPIMGAVKTHQRAYLEGSHAEVLAALEVGERTPLFAIGEDRLSWYQRLPTATPRGWDAILRGELPRTMGIDEASALADRATAELPRFAGIPHRDPRAPQNLTPIAALEGHLRRRLGDRRLALRAVRAAARQAGAVSVATPLEEAA